MRFPQELIDEILNYLPLDDEQNQQSLRNCSLVAKSWTNPSQGRLFKTVEIQEATFRQWLDTIPPAHTELLRHVHSLSYITTAEQLIGRVQEHRIDVLRDYLPSFHRLQHLTLSFTHIPSDISRQIGIFSAFRHGLSQLSLQCCTVTISALVALINFFPSLDRLDLHNIVHDADGEAASPLRRPLIRKLHTSRLHKDALDILAQLSELGLVFEELDVDGSWDVITLYAISCIVDSLGVNVKRLRALRTYRTLEACMYITRAHCETC